MEETIGYEALFSPEEWDSLEDWEPDPDQPHKVTVWYPPGEFEGNDARYEVECSAGRCGVKAVRLPLRSLMLPPSGDGSLDPSADDPRSPRRRKPSTNKEADVEETIGYEALFSPEEWDSLEDWEPDPDQPHKVTVWYPPGEFEGNDARYEVECDVCGHISAEDSLFEAEKLATLHEILRARPVQNGRLER